MLEAVLRYVNNRFERERVAGRFSIEGGSLEVERALDGQYVWIEGSMLNDGLHHYPMNDLDDEEFNGEVVLLAVPRPLVELADEIEGWCAENASAIGGPYQSESFGGYSYTRFGASSGSSEAPMEAWQAQFGGRLHPYRKVSRNWT